MSKPLFREYKKSNKSNTKYKAQREAYKERNSGFVKDETPKNAVNINPVNKSQKRRKARKNREFAKNMTNKEFRIKQCIKKRKQNEQEERWLLTTRQEEVKEDLARRGLLDENGNVMLDQIDTNTGCRKGYTPPPKENVVKVNLANAYYQMDNYEPEFRGQTLARLNEQIHYENEIYTTIIEEGQVVMNIDPRFEAGMSTNKWEYKSPVYPREDFVYHKPLPPVKPISFDSPYQGKGIPAVIFAGQKIPWTNNARARAKLELRKLIFYRECRTNPDVIWRDLNGHYIITYTDEERATMNNI